MNKEIATTVTVTKTGTRKNGVQITEKHQKTFFSSDKKYEKDIHSFVRNFGTRSLRTGDKDFFDSNVKVSVEIQNKEINGNEA